MTCELPGQSMYNGYKHSHKKEHLPRARLNLAVSKDQVKLGRGRAGERQKGKKYEWICPFAFSLHLFCPFILLFLLLARKKAKTAKLKQTKSTSKKRNKCQKNADGQVHFSPFFPFLTFLFSPFILLLCFWDFADLLFFGFCRTFFPVLKKLE